MKVTNRHMRNRSVIGHIFLIQIVFFQKSNDGGELEMFWKNARAQRQVDSVGYGRMKYSHALSRKKVVIGSRSQKALDD